MFYRLKGRAYVATTGGSVECELRTIYNDDRWGDTRPAIIHNFAKPTLLPSHFNREQELLVPKVREKYKKIHLKKWLILTETVTCKI